MEFDGHGEPDLLGIRQVFRSRMELSVAELVRVRDQKSHDFCYRQSPTGLGVRRSTTIQHTRNVVRVNLPDAGFRWLPHHLPPEVVHLVFCWL